MDFKFSVGQAVEYTPRGGTAGLFLVVRQMPDEFQQFDRRYRIKNQHEGFERNVLECDLSPSDKTPEEYAVARPPRHTSKY